MIEQVQGHLVNLRRIRHTDFIDIARHANDITVARNTFIPYPYGPGEAHEFIRRSAKFWRKGEAYHYALEDPSTGEFIGGIGLEVISRKHCCVELGYWLGQSYRGRGIVPEAVKLALRVAFKDLKQMRVQAHVFEGNGSSVRVLEKCGFTYEGTERKRIKHRGRWRDLMLFSVVRTEWKSR